jgi:exosortase/archaeosortase family protein
LSQRQSPQLSAALIPRAIAFLLLFALLQLTWQGTRGTVVQRLVVHDGTVTPAALLVNLLTPAVHARAVGFSVAAVGGGINIENGCEGLDALFLLISAMLVAPIAWRMRALGVLVGAVVVFLLNQARILVLFYAYRADHSLFDLLHGAVAPIVVVLLVLAFFYVWLDLANGRVAPTP